MDLTQCVNWKALEWSAAVKRVTLESLLTVIQSVLSMVSVRPTRLASGRSVWILAKVLVESMLSVMPSIIRPSAPAHRVTLETPLKRAQRFQVRSMRIPFFFLVPVFMSQRMHTHIVQALQAKNLLLTCSRIITV